MKPSGALAGLRRRTYEVLEESGPDDRLGRVIDLSLMTLILLNVAALIVESVDAVYAAAPAFFFWFEVFSVLVFSVEYLLRLWSIVESPRFREPVAGRLRYVRTPLAVIDLLAVLPFYVVAMAFDLRFLRVLRLFRLLRLLKLSRYLVALQTFGRVLRAKREELIVSVCVLGLLLVMASSVMYFVETDAQPEAFSSIPATMWWAISTLTTVGYGDVVPITPLGRVLAAFIAALGIAMFALPTSILGTGFLLEFEGRKRRSRTDARCPHCGERWEEEPSE